MWRETDITELLNFRTKSTLAGDLNAKNPLQNSQDSNPSSLKLLYLFIISNFEISPSQCSTYFFPDGRSEVLDTVVHQNVQLSYMTVPDFLDSVHLPIKFSILDHVKAREVMDLVEKFTDWEQFQSLASDLVSPRIKTNAPEEADKVARDFAASTASA